MNTNTTAFKVGLAVLALLVLGIFFSTCSISRNVKEANHRIDSLTSIVGPRLQELPTTQEVERITERQQIQGLLYEEAIDNKKLSIAEIQVRLNNLRDSTSRATKAVDPPTPVVNDTTSN